MDGLAKMQPAEEPNPFLKIGLPLHAAGRSRFEVKFLVRLPPVPKTGARPFASQFPARSKQRPIKS
jgi:hypothetical protein